MKAVVLAGGRLLITPQIRALCDDASLVVAADSGLRHARSLDLEPVAVVGDFDSVAQEDLLAYPDLSRLRHPVRKDALDLELAIDLARQRGASELTLLGAFGSRLDQTLAALLIAMRLHREGLPVALFDGERDAHPVIAGEELRLELPPGTVFSLLALEESRCSVSGAAYTLEREPLPFGVGLGLSNSVVVEPVVELHEGSIIVIVERTLPTETAVGV